MPQMKEQEKSPERELHEMDGGKRFIRERVIRVLQELSENCKGMKKDTETVRKNQSENESPIPEEKNALEGINSRVVRLKERWGRSPCPRATPLGLSQVLPDLSRVGPLGAGRVGPLSLSQSPEWGSARTPEGGSSSSPVRGKCLSSSRESGGNGPHPKATQLRH